MRVDTTRYVAALACLFGVTLFGVGLTSSHDAVAAATDASALYDRLSPIVWRVVVVTPNGKKIGSAVVIGDEKVVTNCHVLSDGVAAAIVHGNMSYGARLIEPDAERDLCVLSVEGLHLPGAQVAPLLSLKIGQHVYAIGSPFARENTMSDGLISGFVRDPDRGVTSIQISAPISPGSSGGGLFDERGRLIGITARQISPSQAENINFAIPAEWLADVPERARLQLAQRSRSTNKAEPATTNKASEDPVRPADFHRSTPSGVPVLLSSHASWSKACVARFTPHITVVQPPLHGSIDIREGDYAIGSNSPCAGQMVHGAQVFYIPDTSFKGQETVRYVADSVPGVTRTALIDVR
ncbi:S1C family serine protease [Burkholderia lata]|uniref:S1C family serine protease n=1 Tax=Burkholderia lata (strain ATCC 17760 / DSM 23089 / LMG 22485 / NCIMB 9086 / R18194 / 383) TaxID=482957 RepID=UPI001453EF48|nr:serine protease [Burkholderia lata]VWM08972.1 peptidase S1 and S6, chymotrypsin/Hap [Burkholderia lata]